ncbi:purine-nucleoside phosphorylase [Candidatus Merdisoma sp. JLR.KK006]|uniref:purine-nucleoside phosphorylase n=1 Tax=Candidatus Merdisoma sp. JLR.KK006 TaxID=3112626 RepID=UPI002FF0C20D
MNQAYEKLLNCYESCKSKVDFVPKVALVLGSGLGDFADTIRQEAVLDYGDIEGFPQSTVEGHQGRFIFGYVKDVPVVCMQGRVHYYEGYPMNDVVLPIRLMKLMGAEILFLTNAAGGVNLDYRPGDLMLIRDHISVLVPSPLIGPNCNALGLRFCDMSDTYDGALRSVIRKTAEAMGISIQEGVYMQFTGPQYETPAEIRMARTLGADAVGMSTACEAVAANHMGMHICGISCITNMAAGVTSQPLSHEEVQETADRTAPLFKKLVTESIGALAEAI